MRLPLLLSRRNPNLSKHDFGHVLVIAGSPAMLGAAALTALAAMRSGAGLVTAAVPQGANLTLQKKISHVVMTLPLAQTASGAFSAKGFQQLKKIWHKFDSVAIGPGIGRQVSTRNFARRVIEHCPKPLVVDADGLYALAEQVNILRKAKGPRILTPHAGEMSRLIGLSVKAIEKNRKKAASEFSSKHDAVVLLKGHRTVVAAPDGRTYINRTGNAGMATAGSGDVLTGMIAAFLGQGLVPFQAACLGAYYHGRAGDLAARQRTKLGMTAVDILDYLSKIYV